MKSRWIPLLLLGVAFAWLTTRPAGGNFMRVPVMARPAPAWTMPDLDGRPIASTNFNGQVIVLNFWATWCPTCLLEIPDLNEYYTAHATNGLVLIGASTDEGGAEPVRDFVRRNRLAYPVLLADAAAQDAFGGIPGLPVTFVIARDGRFYARYHGPLTRKELESVVTPLLAAPRPAPGTLVPAETAMPAGTSGPPRIPPPPLLPPGL